MSPDPPAALPPGLRSHFVLLDDGELGRGQGRIRLHYVEAGPADGPAVVLLHGFPEFWFGWRRQIPALAAAGFRVIAPDLRGYNRSDKPPCVADYAPDRLVADVAGLIDRVAGGRAAVVGHDWGGVVAWLAAARHPDRVRRMAILNAPHPSAYRRALWRSSQLLRSYYAILFQIPWLPEALLRWNDYAIPRRFFARGPAAADRADVGPYLRGMARPGALTAMINYYRAAAREFASVSRPALIRVPTLVIWGDRDPYLVPSLADDLGRWVADVRVEHLPAATHWVQHDAAERVNQLLTEFLRPAPSE